MLTTSYNAHTARKWIGGYREGGSQEEYSVMFTKLSYAKSLFLANQQADVHTIAGPPGGLLDQYLELSRISPTNNCLISETQPQTSIQKRRGLA